MRRRAEKRISEQMATITTKIHVENTVFVTAEKTPLSANACGGIDRICGAFHQAIFSKIIDEIFELQEIHSFSSECGKFGQKNLKTRPKYLDSLEALF